MAMKNITHSFAHWVFSKYYYISYFLCLLNYTLLLCFTIYLLLIINFAFKQMAQTKCCQILPCMCYSFIIISLIV